MTRSPLLRSEVKVTMPLFSPQRLHIRQAAAVTVGTYSPWEPTATVLSAGVAVGSAARGASAPTEGGEGRGHIVSATRLQLVIVYNRIMKFIWTFSVSHILCSHYLIYLKKNIFPAVRYLLS